ncbi:MAG: hypothetical protein GY847_17160 [Proteobacteria bacterium]|nr:hypothetical protein [Pseudomonadota bacterium]
MVRKPKQQNLARPVLVAPDNATLHYVNRFLIKAGLKPSSAITAVRGLIKTAKQALEKGAITLLLVPSSKLIKDQLSLVRYVNKTGGIAIVWSSGGDVSTKRMRDAWLLERLLEQAGAVTASHLTVLVEVAKIITVLGMPPLGQIRIKGRLNDLTRRFITAQKIAGIATENKQKSSWFLELSTNDELFLNSAQNKRVALGDPNVTAEALALLNKRNSTDFEVEGPLIEPSWSELDMIVRPPARLLSETTSKRIATYFGIAHPLEKLCSSATEAARFASSITGPVVLKLSKPAFENKSASGGVRIRVQGASAVRRAVHELESLDAALGPPKALGILVSEFVDGDLRVWVRMRDYTKFGRVLLVGPGDIPSNNPQTALAVPASIKEVQRALVDAGLGHSFCADSKIALAITRFAALTEQLGPRIDRAEIHPLVATEAADEALALDALVAIAEP